ncbi:amino acid adenylation domain-containing protein [Streptomyces sp. NPDC050619]|uniref:amino acid adenylation domain-containing protein n=1 Tax=Streptomyces sp. NPDC050619 TaxID=3157214 RepID=UPI0034357411
MVPKPPPDRVVSLILRHARTSPEAVALRQGDESVTYEQLEITATSMALALRRENPSGAPVAVASATTVRTVLSFFACLLAGFPYVPIDPALPAPRRRLILEDAGCALLLHDEEGAAPPDIGGAVGIEVVAAGRLRAEPSRASADLTPRDPDAFNILYTSGSTGQPKGVLTTQANVVAFIEWTRDIVRFGPDDVVLCQSPLHFDMHILDLFAAMSAGAGVVLVDARTAMFPRALYATLAHSDVTFMLGVPAAWAGLLSVPALGTRGLPRLRLGVSGGEELPVDVVRELYARLPDLTFINMYGPVETNAVTSQVIRDHHLTRTRLPIGVERAPTRIFLLNQDDETASAGEVGEMVVSGPTVSPGYVNDPAKTRGSRVSVVADGQSFECYRTGDYALRDHEGVLHFRGRRDHRIKTRGFRVELGDVETVLRGHERVEAAVVVPVRHARFTHVLHAYVEPTDGKPLTAQELMTWCRAAVPAYMLPRSITVRRPLPRLSNGKLDRALLTDEAAAEGKDGADQRSFDK